MTGKLRLSLLGLIFLGVAFFLSFFWSAFSDEDSPPEGNGLEIGNLFDRRLGPVIPEEARSQIMVRQVPRGGAMHELLVQQGLSAAEAQKLIAEVRPVYNLARIMPGNGFELQVTPEGQVRRFVYEIDELKRLLVRWDGASYSAEIVERPVEVVPTALGGTIQQSFWNAVLRRGESPQLVMQVFELMQWDIDFTAIQPGDSYRFIYEKRYSEGEFLGYGNVLALEFRHGGRSFFAFCFPDPKSGKLRFFDAEGRSVRKAFLKVPFTYNYRISSGFSYSRLHPVTGRRQPHYGVDYAAPTGTPVLASAAGRVVFAGWNGGSGRMVKLRHPNGYYTYYLHLSSILVRAGQSVSQGQVIGRVGSTGLATGPHLDYRIQDPQGTYLNPKKYVALPSEEGVPKSEREAFEELRDEYLRKLDSIPFHAPATSGIAVAG